MSFEEVTVDLKDRGLYLISGFNTLGKDSNGAGKSALLSGITWILFGRTQSGLSGTDIVRWGQRSCRGILVLTDNTHTYKIVRSLETLEFFIDDKAQIGQKKDIQALINQSFGTDYNLFVTFNIFTKAWSKFITEVGDSDRKKLFKSILMLQPLDNAYEKAKDIFKLLNTKANNIEGEIKQLNNSLEELDDLLKKNKELAEDDKTGKEKTVEALLEQKRILKPEMVDFTQDKAELTKEIEAIKLQKLDEKLEYLNIQLSSISNLIFHDSANLDELEKKLEDFNSIELECDKCGQKVPPRYRNIHKRELEVTRKNSIEAIATQKDDRARVEKEIYDINAHQKHQGDLQDKIKSIERCEWEQNVKWDKYMEFCQMADKSLGELQQTSNYTRVIELTQDKTNRVRESISDKEASFKSYMSEIDLFNYLTWVYSRGGVVNLIIQKCFMRLKALTNFYLKKVCSEGFRLEIAPQRALKSGEYKDEVDIFIWQGSRRIPYASLSSGQQQRINMAMLVSLFQFGREIGANNFDFLLLDEIVDLSLAEAGQEAALELLYDLKPSIFHIVIISHKEGLKGRFDKEIQVIRGEDEVSKIV